MRDRRGTIFLENLTLTLLSRYSWFTFILPTGAWSDQQRTDSQGDTLWPSGGRVLPQRNSTERRKQEILLAGKSVAHKLEDFCLRHISFCVCASQNRFTSCVSKWRRCCGCGVARVSSCGRHLTSCESVTMHANAWVPSQCQYITYRIFMPVHFFAGCLHGFLKSQAQLFGFSDAVVFLHFSQQWYHCQ